MLQSKTLKSFDSVIKIVSKKYPYVIETKGSRKVLYVDKEKLAYFRPGKPIPDLQTKEAKKLMSLVKASATRYIKKHEFIVPIIEKEYPVIFTNHFFWESIPANTQFFVIDAKHAYWRIAYLQGLISKKSYEKYAENKDMKMVKNISLALLNSLLKREYFINNEKIAEIECDTSLYKQVYNNIRYFSYNLCGRLRNELDSSCFAYRTDGVFILKPGLCRAKKIFEENNLLYKIEKFIKIDNKSYANEDGEIKRFV
jgi:hypothetical protein